jgi:hypothetical protein
LSPPVTEHLARASSASVRGLSAVGLSRAPPGVPPPGRPGHTPQ